VSWSPTSWRGRPNPQDVAYDDRAALDTAVARLSSLPPLVTSWEIERLRGFIAEAQEGKRFVLQGGDCAETTADCTPDRIVNKLKILLKMSLVLILGGRKPVVRIGRFAGQYAKPRSSPTEKQGDEELPSYFGDLINRAEFTAAARRPDPANLIRGYEHAAMTLNLRRRASSPMRCGSWRRSVKVRSRSSRAWSSTRRTKGSIFTTSRRRRAPCRDAKASTISPRTFPGSASGRARSMVRTWSSSAG
jgi:3-deoxy-D-arabino-heptulosonate 7-phosphate (DAHP) synthase class II